MRNVPLLPRLGATAVLAFAGLFFPVQAQAPLDLRVALVIGNSGYAGSPLVNPANDARAMGDTLRGLGFTVVELRDASKNQMVEAVAQVRSALRGKQGVGMLYYAGHGLQLDWRNYMVPVDARLRQAGDVAGQAVDISTVIDAFQGAGTRVNILVLDACRDNPFAGAASSKGLAPLDAPPGTFLAYATAPGNVAEDGDATSGNGLYTQFLLQELKKPTAKIEDVFKRVRFSVRRASQGRQIPWESTSLESDFFFEARPPLTSAQREELKQKEVARWNVIRSTRDPSVLVDFMREFPGGVLADVAQFRLDDLQAPGVRPSAPRPKDPPTAKFKVGDSFTYLLQDGQIPALRQTQTLTVQAVDLYRAIFEPGVYEVDFLGNTLVDVRGMHLPRFIRQTLVVPDLFVGKRWQSVLNHYELSSATGVSFMNMQVVGREVLDLPAGRFDAFKIEASGAVNDQYMLERTYWVDATTLLELKAEGRSTTLNGRVYEHTIRTLQQMKRAS